MTDEKNKPMTDADRVKNPSEQQRQGDTRQDQRQGEQQRGGEGRQGEQR